MTAVILPFVPRPDPDREARMIREARAIYDSLFPTADNLKLVDSSPSEMNPDESA